MIRAVVAALALMLLAAVPAQARDWNWTTLHSNPTLVVCKFWHPTSPYGPLWELKSVGINTTAGPATVGVSVRRGSSVIHHWSASLAPGQWSAMGTVFASPITGDVVVAGAGTPAGGAGGDVDLAVVTYC